MFVCMYMCVCLCECAVVSQTELGEVYHSLTSVFVLWKKSSNMGPGLGEEKGKMNLEKILKMDLHLRKITLEIGKGLKSDQPSSLTLAQNKINQNTLPTPGTLVNN